MKNNWDSNFEEHFKTVANFYTFDLYYVSYLFYNISVKRLCARVYVTLSSLFLMNRTDTVPLKNSGSLNIFHSNVKEFS